YAPIEITSWSFASLSKKEDIISSVKMLKTDVSSQMSEFQFGLSRLLWPLFIISSAILLILLLILFRFGIKSSDKFVKPIQELTVGVKDIASGDFDKKLDIRTGDEIESLAVCFNTMTDELKTYIENLTKATADKERIATELNVATNIQISMLPRDFDFNRDDFEIYATMNAAKEVGGDFYDFYLLDEKHLVITIADVSGKGVPAALFMANSKTILKNFAMTMSSPDDFAAVMALANNQLCQGNDEMMFVTVFMGMLDLETGRFIYVNGGHNPPMVYHKATDKFEYMEVKQNIVLGMMDGMDFEQQEIQLESGDMLYLYTDGVTEAMDIDNNQYGEQRLSDCLNNVDKSADLPTILQNVRDDLSKHVGEAEQSDDITMLAVRVNEVKQQ
ncbi:MAG: SpoIIE family protein phosphatase, partial [Selenomonadaceae bacterium]|nr:SpoIIE family protein phosphatase [Selenomonadaceae bacterium]